VLVAGFTQASFGAVDPGMLHTEADFTRMREKVNAGAQPWKGSWDLLVTRRNSQSNWGPRPVATVIRGGTGGNVALLYNDVHAAYQNALRWKRRPLPRAGTAGLPVADAAEIMRTYSGWAPAAFAGPAKFSV
jgi:hypothetical protein